MVKIENCCRLCLTTTTTLSSLHLEDDESITYWTKLKECVPETVQNDQNYPLTICELCTVELNMSYQFKTKCLTSYKRLKETVQINDTCHRKHSDGERPLSDDIDDNASQTGSICNVIKLELPTPTTHNDLDGDTVDCSSQSQEEDGAAGRRKRKRPKHTERDFAQMYQDSCDDEDNSNSNFLQSNNNKQKLHKNNNNNCAGSCVCRTNQNLLTVILRRQDTMSKDIQYLVSLAQAQILNLPNGDSTSGTPTTPKHISSGGGGGGSLISTWKPLVTPDELETFNQKLEDRIYSNTMCAMLQMVGGRDVADTTRRVLSRIMDNHLALLYNWTGKNKRQFSSLFNVVNVITESVRRNPSCRGAMQQEIESTIKAWFRNAGDRDGGRSRRNVIHLISNV